MISGPFSLKHKFLSRPRLFLLNALSITSQTTSKRILRIDYSRNECWPRVRQDKITIVLFKITFDLQSAMYFKEKNISYKLLLIIVLYVVAPYLKYSVPKWLSSVICLLKFKIVKYFYCINLHTFENNLIEQSSFLPKNSNNTVFAGCI